MVRGKSWAKPRTFCRVASSFVTPHCGPLTGREVIHPPIPPTLYSHVVSIKSTQNRYSVFATHPCTAAAAATCAVSTGHVLGCSQRAGLHFRPPAAAMQRKGRFSLLGAFVSVRREMTTELGMRPLSLTCLQRLLLTPTLPPLILHMILRRRLTLILVLEFFFLPL
jgi:hypothetical protein